MLVKDIIARERKKRGMSAAQLAEIVHVNKGTINRYENGNIKVIPVDILEKLADVFGYEFDDFVSGDPKYRILANDMADPDIVISEDDQVILNWFHSLPDEHQAFLMNIASHYSK